MPALYEHIKESYKARGKPEDEAQRLAAMTFIKRGKGGSRSSRAKSLHSDISHAAMTTVVKNHRRKKR